MLETFTLAGQAFAAHPERALYWPAQQVLLVSDLHLGKADTFRQHGISVPQAVQSEDLQRLRRLLSECQPARCLILGDFVHGRIVADRTAQAWNALVQDFPATQFELIVGNHDRHLQPAALRLHAVHPWLQIAGVALSHEPLSKDWLGQAQADLNIHGHLHCAMRVEGSGRKLPALAYRPPHLSMPAFSGFTAGAAPQRGSQAVWVFLPEPPQVVRLR